MNKIERFNIVFFLANRNNMEPFLHRIVTCDEKWITYDNRKRKVQWLDKNDRPKHFSKPYLHPKKALVTVWWSSAGVIHYSFLKPGQTITAEMYY